MFVEAVIRKSNSHRVNQEGRNRHDEPERRGFLFRRLQGDERVPGERCNIGHGFTFISVRTRFVYIEMLTRTLKLEAPPWSAAA